MSTASTSALESLYRLNAVAALLASRARAMRLRIRTQRSPLAGPAVSPVPDAATSAGGPRDGALRHARGDGSAVASGPTCEDTKARG